MSPRITAKKTEFTRAIDGRVFVALGLGLSVAPVALTAVSFPQVKGKTQNQNGANTMSDKKSEVGTGICKDCANPAVVHGWGYCSECIARDYAGKQSMDVEQDIMQSRIAIRERVATQQEERDAITAAIELEEDIRKSRIAIRERVEAANAALSRELPQSIPTPPTRLTR
jgi:hypothetical protein